MDHIVHGEGRARRKELRFWRSDDRDFSKNRRAGEAAFPYATVKVNVL